MVDQEFKPIFQCRRAFLVGSWLGPLAGLLALPRLLEAWSEAGEFVLFSEGGFFLLIFAFLYLGLWIVPWVTARAESISDFRELHAFGVAIFLTFVVAILSEALKFRFPMMNFLAFVLFFYQLRKFYRSVAKDS